MPLQHSRYPNKPLSAGADSGPERVNRSHRVQGCSSSRQSRIITSALIPREGRRLDMMSALSRRLALSRGLEASVAPADLILLLYHRGEHVVDGAVAERLERQNGEGLLNLDEERE